MPRSGGQAGRRGHGRPQARRRLARGAGTLERGGNLSEGPRPSSEVETRQRGRHALERRGEFRGVVPTPRSRRRFARGVPVMVVWWAAEAFWVWALFVFWAAVGAGRDL
jgi:hypothetical protein